MGLENLFSGAKDMFDKAKHLVEDATGIDIDKAIANPSDFLEQAKDAIAHPENLLEQAKAKGSELFSKMTGNDAPVAVDETEETDAEEGDEDAEDEAETSENTEESAETETDDESEEETEEETEEEADDENEEETGKK
jgi:hypothetical protein